MTPILLPIWPGTCADAVLCHVHCCYYAGVGPRVIGYNEGINGSMAIMNGSMAKMNRSLFAGQIR